MIPYGISERNFIIKEQPNKTYAMDIAGKRIRSYSDGIEAIKQSVFKILNTERYQYVIYSWDYGIETLDLYGSSKAYAMSELKRRITEALMWDLRIKSVDNFEFSADGKTIICTFTVHTVLGDINAKKAVNI